MTALLDVNVLIALVDPAHVHAGVVRAWFDAGDGTDFATCPLTENGLIRIVSNPRYPNPVGSPAAAVDLLNGLRNLPGHRFWPDDIGVSSAPQVDLARLPTATHITDTYLLALAVSGGGRLATLDRRLVTTAVRDGAAALTVIG